MSLSKNQIPKHCRASFEDLCSGASLFMHVAPDDLPKSLLPRVTRDSSGLLTFDFPLMHQLGGVPQNTTYVLGTDRVDDSEAHRDLTPKNSVNCHLTLRGSMHAKGALVHDDLHDDGGGLMVPLHDAVPADDIGEIHAFKDDIYLFFGGKVTHEVTSGDDGRLSTMRHYIFDV